MCKIGVLAVQGAFAEHIRVLESLGAECVPVRQRSDLSDGIEGLVLPGGESTAQGRLLSELSLMAPLRERITSGMPVLATCAGVILLSQKLTNDNHRWLGTLPVEVTRNAYGRQIASFMTTGRVQEIGSYPMVFIRAPRISAVSDGVRVLASVQGSPCAVLCGKQLALTFHPELTGDTRLHAYFLKRLVQSA